MTERFVIIKNINGITLNKPIKITKSMIKEMQELYIGNLVRVARDMSIIKMTPNSIGLVDRWTQNPYINYDDKDMFYKLGKSCVEDGMHWLLIVKDNKIYEGVHRVMALRELVARGDYTEEELEFPALDVTNDKFSEPVKIEFFKFRNNFDNISKYGMSTRYLFYNNFSGANANFMAQSSMMKHIYYEWKSKYGKEFKQHECINSYDKLMELVNDKEKYQ